MLSCTMNIYACNSVESKREYMEEEAHVEHSTGRKWIWKAKARKNITNKQTTSGCRSKTILILLLQFYWYAVHCVSVLADLEMA